MKLLKIYNKYRYWLKYVLMGIVVIALGLIYIFSKNLDKLNINKNIQEDIEEATEFVTISQSYTESATKEREKIYVYVCGEVLNPGVYECDLDDRVVDAINLAGGALDNSNLKNLNLADKLSDGLKIYVPNNNEVESEYSLDMAKDSSINGANSSNSKVNINKASKEELMTLSGIGESKAAAIISYRNEKGAFKSIEEIKNISGIKEQAFEKIKDFICV